MRFGKVIATVLVLGLFLCASSTISAQPPEQTKIVAIGDGIIRGGDLLTTKGWVSRLRKQLAEDFPDEYGVDDKGRAGDTARGVLSRLDADVIARGYGIVLIGVGTMDAFGWNRVAPPSRTVNAYQAEMDKILKEIQQQLPESAVFLVGFTTPVKEAAEAASTAARLAVLNFTQEELESKFSDYNAVLKELAETYGYTYIDIPSQWPSDLEERVELLADGVYPNDAGYDKMADIIYGALRGNVVHPMPSLLN